MLIDVNKFSNELLSEFKTMFPSYFEEPNELINQFLSSMVFVTALAIKKYDEEVASHYSQSKEL